MVNAEGVAMVNGTPQALAARARISSAPKRPALIPPVGAIASGRLALLPSRSALVSTSLTLTSTLGSRRTRSKAARFSRSVVSSSAPPSKKSKIARGRRRRAITRRSSMLTASARFATWSGQRAVPHAGDEGARVARGRGRRRDAKVKRRRLRRGRRGLQPRPHRQGEPEAGTAARADDDHAPGMRGAGRGQREDAENAAQKLHNCASL